MLEAIEHCARNGINYCHSEEDVLKKIKYNNKSNYYQIKKGQRSFTEQHVQAMCEVFGIDANFFFRKDHLQMRYSKSNKMPIDFLIEAVQLMKKQS